MVSHQEAVAGGRRSDPTLDPRAFAGLFGALARGCFEFVTESIRVAGNVIGDIGDLVADGADRAAGDLNERVDRRFDGMPPTARPTRRARPSVRVGAAEIANRAVDGCVDVIERTAKTFEDAYNKSARSDRAARSYFSSPDDERSDAAPISRYDALSVEQVVARLNAMDTADEVRDVLAYEERHKDRKTVVVAAQSRLTTLLNSTPASSANDG